MSTEIPHPIDQLDLKDLNNLIRGWRLNGTSITVTRAKGGVFSLNIGPMSVLDDYAGIRKTIQSLDRQYTNWNDARRWDGPFVEITQSPEEELFEAACSGTTVERYITPLPGGGCFEASGPVGSVKISYGSQDGTRAPYKPADSTEGFGSIDSLLSDDSK